jgi:hypothetical protein
MALRDQPLSRVKGFAPDCEETRRRILTKLMTVGLASAGLLLLSGLMPPASAQTYACPPGYYLGSDYRCWPQGYAVAPPVAPYPYYPPRAYYAQPYAYYYPGYSYPGFSLRFGFGGGHRDYGHHYGHYHHH